MRVALISCGYADGLPRACSNRGRVLIRGQRAPLVGTVSMDMAMADVSHIPSAEVGDEVVILGRQAGDEISLDEFAEFARHHPARAAGAAGESRAARLRRRARGDPRVVELIEKKRDGGTHTRAELEAIVLGADPGRGARLPARRLADGRRLARHAGRRAGRR